MPLSRKRKIILEVLLGLCIFFALAIGTGAGFALASMKNTDVRGYLRDYDMALPTQILDRNGLLITELFSDEKRDIVPITELPRHLIYALISREDETFFEHHGFSVRGILRAFWNNLRGTYSSGGSSLTQQVAGWYFADRSEISIKRKLKELWYAFLVEKSLTKNEILEIYLNEMYFGHNTNGVEAASQFYFGHSARDITLAESAILVIQLASPAMYSPINHPERARERQLDVLKQMVELNYATQEEADLSFEQYWTNYDYSRSNIASAYFDNQSKAPYFSEYVRLQLNDMLYGAVDINRDGYVVHTTLDLRYQEIAQKVMDQGYRDINLRYRNIANERLDIVDQDYVPIIDLLSLMFDLEDIRVAGAKQRSEAMNYFYTTLNPTLDVLSNLFGLQDVSMLNGFAYEQQKQQTTRTTVEGALITLDNNTGHILAMVGGSDFETKQYNRAVSALVQPGSSFKPLYYSVAISSKKFTPASRLYDGPIAFYDGEGNVYEPMNFLGDWQGSVLLRYALATSMNVPSLQVLEGVGFDAAIDRASRMLGMTDQRNDEVLFPHGYPLGLGVTALAPINMARAFAVFPNQGRMVEPLAIVTVEDRSGNIVLEPDKERARQAQRTADAQIMSPQVAYIMTDLLQSTVAYGTLANRRREVGGFDDMPMAGKTGTTQNWGDAWTVGFSPYMTTAIWFGFDTPGMSLGRYLTGATAAGPVWAKYMKEVHENLPRIDFPVPDTGLVKVRVCAKSGLLPTNECNDGTLEEIFLTGTEPRRPCNIHKFENARNEELLKKLQENLLIEDIPVREFQLDMDLNLDFSGSDTDTDSDPLDEGYNPLLD
ncbi:MAG: PBP1A family penicillin-binding protein [Spirochaetales bacterium]|nr:PBP1A family penicillin-binding protein [Spirochaetales bacterium]